MTKKRFIIDDAGTLIDMETRNMYELAYEVVELLNALNDENEQLKSENIQLTVDNKELKCTNNELYQENEQLKQREQTLTAKIDRILHQRDGNEKQHLKVMSYLHDNYYSIWEECLKELGD